jgi:hypothetical protein
VGCHKDVVEVAYTNAGSFADVRLPNANEKISLRGDVLYG